MEPVEMTRELAARLRIPFKPEEIGKLPRITCPKCSDRKVVCNEHHKTKCDVCGSYISTKHIHLDFVGHAGITDRLLEADPLWSWEPAALDKDTGLPQFDKYGGLWIRLTIAGVTRLGYGDAGTKTGGNAVKEAIGDALRNAAMRFGVGLDLWGAKFKDPDDDQDQDDDAPPLAPPAQEAPPKVRPLSQQEVDELYRKLTTATSMNELEPVIQEARDKWLAVPEHLQDQVKRWIELSKVRVQQDVAATASQEQLSMAGAA